MTLKWLAFLNIILTLTIISCNNQDTQNTRLEGEIKKRIEILERSYKFLVIKQNLEDSNFNKLKSKLHETLLLKQQDSIANYYESIKNIFSKYQVELAPLGNGKDEMLFNILIALDELIYKYIPSRLNFSNYKTIVVPNKQDLKTGDTLRAKIYLTVFDTLYEPVFNYIEYDSTGRIKEVFYLRANNGVGEYNVVHSRAKGHRKISGRVIYSNEFGYKDTIPWDYQYNIK